MSIALKKYQNVWKKNMLLEEIGQEYVDMILKFMSKAKPTDYAFDSLFGGSGNWRVAIPIDYNSAATSNDCLIYLLDKARNLGWTLDLNTKMAFKMEKQTNPNTGEVVERRVELKMGKWVVKFAPEYEDCWIPIQEQIGAQMIIISRHPIDVLRMADFENIQSCHSQGGAYFYCAIEEAQGHGFVGFLVRMADYLKVKDRLNDSEIFSDLGWTKVTGGNRPGSPSRNVNGIRPISRVRARELHNPKEGYSIAMVDQRIYGTPSLGFYDTFVRWLHQKQDEHLPEKINPADFEFAGGYYADFQTYYQYFQEFFADRTLAKKLVKNTDTDPSLAGIAEAKKLANAFNRKSELARITVHQEESGAIPWKHDEDRREDFARNSNTRRTVSVPGLRAYVVVGVPSITLDLYANDLRFNPNFVRDVLNKQKMNNPRGRNSFPEAFVKEFGIALKKKLGITDSEIERYVSADVGADYQQIGFDANGLARSCRAKSNILEQVQCAIEMLNKYQLTDRETYNNAMMEALVSMGALQKVSDGVSHVSWEEHISPDLFYYDRTNKRIYWAQYAYSLNVPDHNRLIEKMLAVGTDGVKQDAVKYNKDHYSNDSLKPFSWLFENYNVDFMTYGDNQQYFGVAIYYNEDEFSKFAEGISKVFGPSKRRVTGRVETLRNNIEYTAQQIVDSPLRNRDRAVEPVVEPVADPGARANVDDLVNYVQRELRVHPNANVAELIARYRNRGNN